MIATFFMLLLLPGNAQLVVPWRLWVGAHPMVLFGSPDGIQDSSRPLQKQPGTPPEQGQDPVLRRGSSAGPFMKKMHSQQLLRISSFPRDCFPVAKQREFQKKTYGKQPIVEMTSLAFQRH
jgi:hypothetical protein